MSGRELPLWAEVGMVSQSDLSVLALKKDGGMAWLGTPDLKCSTIFSPALTS
jgi:hypothetical protein